ncbi:hypothetical protein H5410_045622 [Solanum commersonii]|uniref:RRM domain-containing protein n=1 Tax=Solanum commersonii TaxID=4109 RepID=A0A9J5XDA0_SOLCO|nr:hypothetical protein H5410_045622 [Solanum commersonii]
MAPRETPSNNILWVVNLGHGITDVDLTYLFQNFGPHDSVMTYTSRWSGFLHFRKINDSKEVKDALQGSFSNGKHLNIKFAKSRILAIKAAPPACPLQGA